MKITGIACDVELSSGAVAGFWLSTCARIDLANDFAVVTLYGYTSKAAYEAGKPYLCCEEKQINSISSLTNFNAMWSEAVAALIAAHFNGGTIEQADKPN